jgi:hypothetical protein
MSTQGQGDVVERLRAAAREIRNDGTASQVGLSEQECEDIADEITRLRTLLSSSRGEQGWRLVPEKPTEAMNIAAVDLDATVAAVAFRDRLVPKADLLAHGVYPLWLGWALIEAFLAGIAYARQSDRSPSPTEGEGNV